MSKFKKFVWLIIIIELLLIVMCNIFYVRNVQNTEGRMHRVEAKRVVTAIAEQNLSDEEIATLDLSEYETILSISEFVPDEECNNDYLVESIDGKLYRIEYRIMQSNQVLCWMNLVLLVMVLITAGVFIYVYHKVNFRHHVCVIKCKQHYKCHHSTGLLF